MKKRGLVISNPMSITGDELYIKSSNLDPQELRANLLFWDILDYPSTRIIAFEPDNDTKFLISEGLIQRTEVSFKGPINVAEAQKVAFFATLQHLERQEPNIWSLSTGENSVSFPCEDTIEGRGVLVKLFNAIPVPDKDVALADILEFRDKRQSELLDLRHHLEDTYQKIIVAGDGPMALATELSRLQSSIESHIKVSRESGIKLRLQDLSAELNLKEFAVSALASHQIGFSLGGSLLTGLGASLSINLGKSLKGREPSSNPYRYVSSFHNQLFI